MTRLVVRLFYSGQTRPVGCRVWLADRNEGKRKGERACANFAQAHRQAIELPALSIHSIMGAMAKRWSNILLSLNFLTSAPPSAFWTDNDPSDKVRAFPFPSKG
jgi:hypothetical protein